MIGSDPIIDRSREIIDHLGAIYEFLVVSVCSVIDRFRRILRFKESGRSEEVV